MHSQETVALMGPRACASGECPAVGRPETAGAGAGAGAVRCIDGGPNQRDWASPVLRRPLGPLQSLLSIGRSTAYCKRFEMISKRILSALKNQPLNRERTFADAEENQVSTSF